MGIYSQNPRARNFESPSVIFKDLSLGLEFNKKLTGSKPGSCRVLENFHITESGALQTIDAYSELCQHKTAAGLTVKKIMSLPTEISDTQNISSSANSEAQYYFIVQMSDNLYYIANTTIGGLIQTKLQLTNVAATDAFRKAILIDDKIMFYNGAQVPFLYNPTTNTLLQYNVLTDPTETPTSSNNLPAPDPSNNREYTISFCVAFESTIGSTKASPIGSVDVGRQLADIGEGQYFRINRGTAPAGATAWNAYISVSSADESNVTMLRFTADPIPIAQTSVDFTNASIFRIDAPKPEDNTTEGPIFNYAKVINSRIWATQVQNFRSKARPYRVMWSGVGRYACVFGASLGAGYLDIESGSSNKPQAILMFRNNGGSPAINVLTGDAQSKGKRFTMEAQELSTGTQTNDIGAIQTFVPVEQASIVGTVAGGSVCNTDSSIVYLSTQGLVSTQTNQSTYGVLMNNIISLKIKELIDTLYQENYSKIESIESANKVYWLLYDEYNTAFILSYDYIKEAFSKITVEAEHIFVAEGAETNLIKLCFIKNDRLYMFAGEENLLHNKVVFNYLELTGARTRTGYGRLLDGFVSLQHTGSGEIDVSVTGVTKDDVITAQEKHELTAFRTFHEEEYEFYKAHVPMYRNKIITDKVAVGVESTGVSYLVSECGVSFNAVTADYNKNKFGRLKGTIIDNHVLEYWVLQPEQELALHKTQWVDEFEWNDTDHWDDGRQ